MSKFGIVKTRFSCNLQDNITYRNVPKFSYKQVWSNSVDPDQTSSLIRATLFAILSESFEHITLW